MRALYLLCVSGIIKGMRKCGEFKISLSNPRGGKILKSSMSGRVSMVNGWGGGKTEGFILNVGCGMF